MKYIKEYEGLIIDELSIKSKEYQKYAGKYVILEYRNEIYFVKFIKISIAWAKVDIYEWNEHYYIPLEDMLYLNDFIVLQSFDTFEEASKEHKIIQNLKKYNL